MEGDWLGRYGEDVVEEVWGSERGGMLIGMFRPAARRSDALLRVSHHRRRGGAGRAAHQTYECGADELGGAGELPSSCWSSYRDRKRPFLQRNKPDPPWMIYRRESKRLVTYFQRDEPPAADDQFVYIGV